MKRVLSLFMLMLILVPCAVAQETAAVGRLDAAAVIRAAAEVTREKYPNADEVLVDDLIRVRYEKDGASLTTDETWFKVLTEKGRRDNLSLSFHFTLPYGDAKLDVLEIIKPDGAVTRVDLKKQSRVMVARSQMGSNIYNPNSKVLQVGLPGLEVGDTVCYRSIRRIVKPRVPGTWSDYMVFEYTNPIRRMVYEVDGPADLPLRSVALKDEVKGTVKYSRSEQNNRLLYRWEVTHVPRMYEEPNMPPLHNVVQRLLVSTIADWREISQWYWRLSEGHFEPTEAMRQKVAELTQGLAAQEKKIGAIFKFVSQEIRYMGITTEKEAPGYEPHDVKITFENKYGVCRDKAALLVSMLRLAGIEAYPVLIHNGPKKDADVPQPYFNHAVVAARIRDAYTLMDPTDENTRELFPAYLCNQSYLVARPTGETLLTSPIIPAGENLLRINTQGRVNANGDLFAESTLRFEGINDNAYRGYFAGSRPEVRRRYFERLVKRVVPGARLADFTLKPDDLRDTSAPLTVNLRIEARDVPVTGSETIMLPVPRLGAHAGMVNFILGQTGLKQRKYPLVTKFACGVEEELTLDISALAGKTLALPEFEQVNHPAITANQTLTRKNGVLKSNSSFLLKVVEFTPEQYDTLKDTLRKTEFNARKMPLFAPAATDSDAVIVSSLVTYDIENAHAWTETRQVIKKILTYAGKKDHAELKFNYNPAWEELKLEEAGVVTADGTLKHVQPEEQNLMDAAWAGSAPRYPAAKTLVVSLPGVDVGSVITYRVTRTVRERPFFSAREYFRSASPVEWKRVVLDCPRGFARTVETRHGGQLKTVSRAFSAPRQQTLWTAAAQKAVKRELNLPPWWSFTPSLCLSAGDWSAYADEVRHTLVALAENQPLTEQTAAALVAGVKDKRARMILIRDFAVERIRLAGPDLNDLPLSALTPADRTLHDGYGNTADRAILIYALLREAGFKPEFVLASRSPVVAGLEHPLLTCPQADDFPAVLVRVRLADEDIYLNDTDQYSALGATPHDGNYGLALRRGKIITITAPKEKQDRVEKQYNVILEANGDAVITRNTIYYGGAFAAFHRKFAEITPEERNRYQQEAVAAIAQSAAATETLKTQYDTYPGTETLEVRVKHFAVREGKRLYFALPGTLDDLLGLRADTRENPVYWPQPRRLSITTNIIPPEGFADAALMPAPSEWFAPVAAGVVALARQVSGKALQFCYTAELTPAVIAASDYPELLDLQRRLAHPRSRMLLLETN